MQKNEVFLTNSETDETLLDTIKARKLKFFGHTKYHNSILTNILEGKVEGRRPRGRHQAQWCDNIKELSRYSILDCTILANRVVWHQVSSQAWTEDRTVK